MDVMKAAELLIEKIKTDYKDDIAVVVIMGSYIYNETHQKSDLDMYYVPNTKRGNNLGFTFILDGIGFDFWPISWERLERIANYDEKITSIITEGRVIYYSSENDITRFNEVKEKALDITDRKKFIEKAFDKFNNVYQDYWGLQNAQTISSARKYAISIIYSITYALALINRITVKRGRGKLKQEILNMPLVPEHFSELYDTVFTLSDIDIIKKSYEQLIKNTESLMNREKDKFFPKYIDALNGFYEELVNYYNKIDHACELNDAVTALYASVELTREIDMVLEEAGINTILPDLVDVYDPNHLEVLQQTAKIHQSQFVEFLKTNGIILREFNNFNELENYLKTL